MHKLKENYELSLFYINVISWCDLVYTLVMEHTRSSGIEPSTYTITPSSDISKRIQNTTFVLFTLVTHGNYTVGTNGTGVSTILVITAASVGAVAAILITISMIMFPMVIATKLCMSLYKQIIW